MLFELTVAVKSKSKSKSYDQVVYEYYTDNIHEANDEYLRVWDKYPKAHAILSYDYGIMTEGWTE